MRRFWCLFLVVALLAVPVTAAAPEVPAKSSCLMDIETGTVLQEQNADEPLAPASVTKVMTMLLVMEALDSGRIQLSDMVTASEAAAAKGGSQIYLKVGEQMSVDEMLKSVAVSSANDCACALAEHIAGSEAAFVDMMNSRAGELGMKNTHFVNCTGLDDGEDAASHRTTARDIAIMSRELMKNHPDIQKYTTIWMDTVRNGTFGLSNTNKLVRFYPGATGLKTGFTSGAGYCLSATAEKNGLGLIAVVMGSSTSQDRFNACKQLLDYGFAGYGIIHPEADGTLTVPVKLGKADFVTAVPAEDTALLIDKSQLNSVNIKTELIDQVTAPVSQGQRLGTMTVTVGEQILKEIPLVAEAPVQRLSGWDIFVILLKQMLMAK
nr:D-alanyl-D-alanine carboxypeptidase [Oscillospiraceae bacterium]MBQ8245442.1 D-alanyl-D-alanine carboxypeptidase [Oscillospiraceae bacterium]